MTLSLSFRSADSRATIIISWQQGQITKRYNGQKPYRAPLAEAPRSVAAFEQLCRQRFLLGTKWQCTSLIGETS